MPRLVGFEEEGDVLDHVVLEMLVEGPQGDLCVGAGGRGGMAAAGVSGTAAGGYRLTVEGGRGGGLGAGRDTRAHRVVAPEREEGALNGPLEARPEAVRAHLAPGDELPAALVARDLRATGGAQRRK